MSTPATNYQSASTSSPEWKQELNERLAEARSRRTREKIEQATLPVLNRFPGHSQSRVSELAARVAARYAKAPSYSEILARGRQVEAQRESEAAPVTVEPSQPQVQLPVTTAGIARQHPAAGAQGPPAAESVCSTSCSPDAGSTAPALKHNLENEHHSSPTPLEVAEKRAEAPGVPNRQSLEGREAPSESQDNVARSSSHTIGDMPNSAETGFSASSLTGAPVGAAAELLPVQQPESGMQEDTAAPEVRQPLPVNLIEFPRELVAARRARPRLEEGPLREDAKSAAGCDPQLTIFEVAPESADIASSAAVIEPATTEQVQEEWPQIHLDRNPVQSQAEERLARPLDVPMNASVDAPIEAAPIEDRIIAWIVDLTLVLFAFVFFVFVSAASDANLPRGRSAWIAGGLFLAGIYLLYQYLFFKFADGTPGMRYAKIALCTFDDEAPTRKQMRARIPYLLFSAAPLGLGYLWAWFDANRLSWHDRLTRTYQRSYQ